MNCSVGNAADIQGANIYMSISGRYVGFLYQTLHSKSKIVYFICRRTTIVITVELVTDHIRYLWQCSNDTLRG